MKSFIVFAAVLAVACAALLPAQPQSLSPDAQATIVEQNADIAPDHSNYKFGSQTSNGISQSESGQLQQARSAEESPAYVVQGEYSYIGADGQTYTVRYTADASGFHPEGAHLPKAL